MAETSDSTLLFKDDMEQDTLSWAEMFRHGRKKIENGFGEAMKVIKERTKAKEKSYTKEKHQWGVPCGVTFVRGMSALQLFLGFCCIVIALVGFAAAFDAKQRITKDAFDEFRYSYRELHKKFIRNMTDIAKKEKENMTNFYMELVKNTTEIAEKDRQDMWEFHLRLLKNMTITAKNEKKALIEQCQKQTRNRASENPDEEQSNTGRSLKAVTSRPHKAIESSTTLPSPYGQLEDLDEYDDPPASHLKYYHEWDFPRFDRRRNWDSSPRYPHDLCDIQQHLCYYDTIDEEVKRAKLIMDFLCVPAWTGTVYIITGLVGLRMMASKKPMEYLQVSLSGTVLNFLAAILFAPGMLAVGILQWHFGEQQNSLNCGFRHVVGKITVGFAGACLLVSIVLCIVGCCCPVSSHLQDNNYKRLSESTETLAEEKPRDEAIMESTQTLAGEKPRDEDKNEIMTV